MYKIMVVDDKKDVTEGIIRMGEWNSLGCEVIGKAHNGKEALELIKENPPHILITDIRMPKMDGIQLTKAVKELDPNIKVIILSGYDEFAYAQQAVKLGAEEYLLKPAQIHIISEAVTRCIDKLDKEKTSQQEMILRKQRLIQSLPLLRDEFFQLLIHEGEEMNDKRLEEKLHFLKIGLAHEKVMMVLIDLDDYQYFMDQGGQKEVKLYKFAVRNLINEMIEGHYEGMAFATRYHRIGLAFAINPNLNQEQNFRETKMLAESICKNVKSYLNTTVTITVSDSIVALTNLNVIYKKLTHNMTYKLFLGNNRVIAFEHIKAQREKLKAEYPRELEKELFLSIRHGDMESVQNKLDSYLKGLMLNRTVPSTLWSKLVEFMILVGSHSGAECETDVLEAIKQLTSREDIYAYMLAYVRTQMENIQELKKSPTEKAIDKAKEYIHVHYGENINLQSTAEHVCMSPTYFSAVFKEQAHQSFIDYLITYRIEMAKEYLMKGHYKVYEVAEKVGYHDRRYFSQIFRKHVGIKPNEFIRKNKFTPHKS